MPSCLSRVQLSRALTEYSSGWSGRRQDAAGGRASNAHLVFQSQSRSRATTGLMTSVDGWVDGGSSMDGPPRMDARMDARGLHFSPQPTPSDPVLQPILPGAPLLCCPALPSLPLLCLLLFIPGPPPIGSPAPPLLSSCLSSCHHSTVARFCCVACSHSLTHSLVEIAV